MQKTIAAITLLAAATLAACGGGSGGYSGAGAVPQPKPTATVAGNQANLPLSETVGGTAAWVDPASHHTLYFLDVDTATGATCTGACLTLWPVFVPNSSAQAQGSMSIITRADGTGKQFAYQGHPLYFYAGDSAADQMNGNGIPDFGGHWHVARPNASSATPAPGGGNCTGIYC